MSIWNRTARRIAASLAGLISLGGLWVALTLDSWVRVDEARSGAPELVIALSSGFEADSVLDPVGNGRLRAAADLARRRGIPRLITTRIVRANGATSDVAQRRSIAAAGYAGRWTILSRPVQTTREEALALSAELAGRHAIVVVTSRFHTRRACAVFERVGFTVECVNGYDDPRTWRSVFDYLYERAAVIKYRRNGWIRR